MEDEVDEGSPLGGFALSAGILAIVLLAVELPASLVGVGWVAGCLGLLAAPAALLLGSLSLITEESPKGRRNARWALILGALSIVGQLAGLVLQAQGWMPEFSG